MRNALPSTGPYVKECAIINLDSKDGPGTHWVAYIKNRKNILYFDSFGDLRPPNELVKYFGRDANIKYNYNRHQNFNSFICGHLCLKFLINNHDYQI